MNDSKKLQLIEYQREYLLKEFNEEEHESELEFERQFYEKYKYYFFV